MLLFLSFAIEDESETVRGRPGRPGRPGGAGGKGSQEKLIEMEFGGSTRWGFQDGWDLS